MQLKKIVFSALLVLVSGTASAMRPAVTINVDRGYYQPVSVIPVSPYYQAPATTYVLPYSTSYDYSYWPTSGYYYDYGYWDYYYPNTPAEAFVKACAVTGVLAVAFALIGAIMSSH